MLRYITKAFVTLLVLILLLLIAMNYYFRHVAHFHAALVSSYNETIAAHHVHPLGYSQIPEVYLEAVIATEDRRFWWDPGIDPVGIARSFVVDVQKDEYVEGGSTVTQQLVDNTLIPHGKSLRYKLEQALYAFGVYDTVSKQETFEMYANAIYFGNGAYGLYNAAESYFGRLPSELNSGELTMLAGIPNAPSNYNPQTNFTKARSRQAVVLMNMVDAGLISEQQSSQIFHQPIRLKSK